MYGLPRKFNIAFDGGGAISSLEDTNDIGFHAVRLAKSNAAGDAGDVLFQLALGGITGHRDFARDTGVVAKPEECVDLAAAIVRVFIRQWRPHRSQEGPAEIHPRRLGLREVSRRNRKGARPAAPPRVERRLRAATLRRSPCPRRHPLAEAARPQLRRRRAAGRSHSVGTIARLWPTWPSRAAMATSGSRPGKIC